MAITIDEIKQAVCGICDNSAAWYEFRYRLLNNESVHLPNVGWATLTEDIEAEVDSYGDAYGDVSFVFEIHQQHFRKHGEYDSYDGTAFNGRLEEVRPKSVRVSNWESVN